MPMDPGCHKNLLLEIPSGSSGRIRTRGNYNGDHSPPLGLANVTLSEKLLSFVREKMNPSASKPTERAATDDAHDEFVTQCDSTDEQEGRDTTLPAINGLRAADLYEVAFYDALFNLILFFTGFPLLWARRKECIIGGVNDHAARGYWDVTGKDAGEYHASSSLRIVHQEYRFKRDGEARPACYTQPS
ncbi:hypothetical protein ARMGADRAFT_1032821 [Armillaria gallica]|uniref:Uncharacterized protein n=1 Tax=Armillaria gallica TaxID=47427 RepID=A0A2H3DMI2_ARMGA|nr:hypothetical protein ARMGADRAFT_1032821 [Armillaria gallica]